MGLLSFIVERFLLENFERLVVVDNQKKFMMKHMSIQHSERTFIISFSALPISTVLQSILFFHSLLSRTSWGQYGPRLCGGYV